MFSSISHFKSIWNTESEATLKCLQMLTDESLQASSFGDYRNIKRMVNHIIACADGIPWEATLPIQFEKKEYHTVQDMIAAYAAATHKVLSGIDQWTDDTLQEETPMYGESWKKGFALWVTVVHQIHHRGQLTVLMRMAGLKVPGIYGPNAEEWKAYNLPEAD
ncbi:MAG: DinB family protein [Sediminibacterium sp.]